MRKLAASPIHDSQLDVELIDLPGEQIPLADGSVDTVLITYTLCTIPDALSALDGMRRVLRPGGKLLFCEHGRAPDESVRAWQNRLNPAWRKIAGGCNMNRDIPSLLKAGGFRVENDYRMYIPGFRALCYNYWGSAVAA
jgi:ubiquinone/menaquinone biosynthesis C-methylase UbiE